jgi:diguanylate cyclase
VNELNETSIISEIESEYRRIDTNWLKLHYNTFALLVFFGVLVECVLGISLYLSGYIEIPLDRYILKYIAVPFFTNLFLLLTGTILNHIPWLSQSTKTYFVSLLFVGVCFVFYSAHIIFDSLFLIFTLPMLLTVVYGDYTLTTITSFVAIVLKVIADLSIRWDPKKASPLLDRFAFTNFLISICVLFAFYMACIVVIRFERAKISASIQKEIERHQMQLKLLTDELTGIYNRTALRSAFQRMEEDQSGTSYAFIMIDLDNFKKLNDTLGHDRGDQCLREFGKVLKRRCADGAVFRFGGDEFCVLFQNQTTSEIKLICEKIQNDLRKSALNQSGILLTASFGIARYKPQMSARELLQNADAALYHSKKSRDAVCIYENWEQLHFGAPDEELTPS